MGKILKVLLGIVALVVLVVFINFIPTFNLKTKGKSVINEKQNIRVYIYDSQKTMQQKKYGHIGALLGLDLANGEEFTTA